MSLNQPRRSVSSSTWFLHQHQLKGLTPRSATYGRYRPHPSVLSYILLILTQLPERLPSLAEMNVRQLYSSDPDLDRTSELRWLTKSVLMNYLELVGIMDVDSAGWTEKIDDLRIIFINMHHLLNEYRPHQVCAMR